MPTTLLQAVNRVNREINQDPAITAFSDDDDSKLVVAYINAGIQELFNSIPNFEALDKTGSVSLVANTRLYNIASDATTLDIYDWSFEVSTDNYRALEVISLQDLIERSSDYLTLTGEPQFAYVEASQLGFYPIPDSVNTVTYKYKGYTAALSLVGATFPFEEAFVDWVVDYAIYRYKEKRGFSDFVSDKMRVDAKFAQLYVKQSQSRPTFFTGG